jgi:glycosyltransferase involved in cell wall biosynthesis
MRKLKYRIAMPHPLVSIVINNFNYGRFLTEAIESALAQSYRNTEVIVVDDGSTDDSRDIIHRYGGRVTSVFKGNGGQGSAYNAGFAASNVEFVCFLDADDTLHESVICQVIDAFHNPQIVKVEWRLGLMDERGREIDAVVPEKELPPGDLRALTIREGPFYDWTITPPSSGNCYSARMLRRVMPVPEAQFRHGADVYLSMLAPIYGSIQRLPAPQGRYRIHEKNNYFGRPLDSNRLLDYIQRFDACCVQLKEHLRLQGIEVEIDDWKARNFNFLWPTRLLRAKSDLESTLPAGASYILVNDDQWNSQQLIEGRYAIPFLERQAEYWGAPTDDKTAIAELLRLRRERHATHIVFSWTALWWFEMYPIFHAWLRFNARCVLENDCVVIFDLREIAAERGCEVGSRVKVSAE